MKKLKVKNQKSKLWYFLLLFFLQFNLHVFSASVGENPFIFCRINLEKSGNQDILGLIDEITAKKEGSVKNELITDAISLVSIKDVTGYGLSLNSEDKLDYLLVINLSDKFQMKIAGRTIEVDIKDKESLAGARTAALEKLLEKALGKNEKVKSIEIQERKIFFNEEKENREKIAAGMVVRDKVIIATNKNLIRKYLKENFPGPEKNQKFSKTVTKIQQLKGGMVFVDNKEGYVTRIYQKSRSEDKDKSVSLVSKISGAGFSFEQIDPENIKGNLVIQTADVSNEDIEKEIASLKKYGKVNIKKEKDLITANFIISKKWLEENLGGKND